MGVISLVIAIILLIVLSFKGVSVLLLAPLLSMCLMIITGDMPGLSAITGPFMAVTASYIKSFFPIFLGGAIFGKIMGECGAADAISLFISNKLGKERAVLAVVLATAILTYGGVSLFVVVFAVYPLAVSMFREGDIPKRLIPGAIALGAFTFTMTALPGSPQFINSMPNNYLGTNIYAAPILGTVAGIIIFGMGMIWLNYRVKEAKKNNEGYGITEEKMKEIKREELPNVLSAFSPIVLIFVLNWIFVNLIFKKDEVIEYFRPHGGIDGNWAVTIGLASAIVLTIFLFKNRRKEMLSIINRGAESSLSPIMNTAMIVGFGGVVKSTAAFLVIKDWVLGLGITGLAKVAISTSIMAGITGSSSGGTGIALEALSKTFLEMGLNPEAIHRVMLVGAGGLDSLPHCGAVITLLSVCGITHSKGYKDIGMVTVVFPVLAVIVMIIINSLTGLV
ncbi:MAG: GntP family permease [Fusobacteriaceae bacterium]